MDATIGSSDFHASGSLTNFLPYLFAHDVIKGELNLSSAKIDLNELQGTTTTSSTAAPSTVTVTPPAQLITQYGTSATASASNPDPGSLQYLINGLTQLQDGTLKNLNALNANASAAISAALTPPTLEQETKNTENFKMTVYGSLKYL
jgi:hypothetical protein